MRSIATTVPRQQYFTVLKNERCFQQYEWVNKNTNIYRKYSLKKNFFLNLKYLWFHQQITADRLSSILPQYNDAGVARA